MQEMEGCLMHCCTVTSAAASTLAEVKARKCPRTLTAYIASHIPYSGALQGC